jgi:hypothetical protein
MLRALSGECRAPSQEKAPHALKIHQILAGQAMAAILFFLFQALVSSFFGQFLRNYMTSGQHYEGNLFVIALPFDTF